MSNMFGMPAPPPAPTPIPPPVMPDPMSTQNMEARRRATEDANRNGRSSTTLTTQGSNTLASGTYGGTRTGA